MRSVMHPSLPKKHYKTRRFLSFLLSQAPLSKPRSTPRSQNAMDHGPNRLKFSWYGPNLVKASAAQKSHESMVPIYLEESAQNKYIGSSLWVKNKNKYIGTKIYYFLGGPVLTLGPKWDRKINHIAPI